MYRDFVSILMESSNRMYQFLSIDEFHATPSSK